MSTTFGVGDGSTTFNLPDLRGRTIAGKDDMGGSAASRLTATYFGTSAAALGAVGGGESQTLTLAQLPTGITARNVSQAISVFSNTTVVKQGTDQQFVGGTIPGVQNPLVGQTLTSTGTADITVTSNNTSGSAHPIVQPTIVCNYIGRII
jgi:microcystin-dependent protein